MTDYDDERDTDEDRRAAIVRRARTEGVEAAYESALAICQDPKAPAQAKSNAARTLLQIGGLFDKSESALPKEPGEMTGEELHAAARKAIRNIERATRKGGLCD